MQVIPVRSTDQLGAFIRLPWSIYRDDPNWVPPLIRDVRSAFDRSKHPFHEHSEVQAFLALRDGKPVGRIAAIRNRNHEKFHEEPVGFFGYFECVNDQAVAEALFDTAAGWVSQRGLRVMRGPTSFSTNETTGFLIDGDDGPPMLMMAYNPPYYIELAQRYGFREAKTLVAYWIDSNIPPDFLVRAAPLIEKRYEVRLRPMRMDRFTEELATVRSIYNQAWEKNWGFVPMTDAEIDHMAAELKPIVDPNLALFVDTPDGESIGFALGLPNFNLVLQRMNGRLFPFGVLKALYHGRKIHQMRVIALGLVEEYRGKGIDGLLYLGLIQNGAARGITECEQSWVLEDNLKMRAAIEKLNGRVYRRYRLYDIEL
jgi:GNAT superfamily N-acetyltransferase